ncbi:MAG: E2F family transcription factor [Candidatus Heimdallarchaeota archaeon]|nr:E2F family transcription factor [Candidatus Heimdallarchaeota archaeon]MDH5644393.1 E2F family transcription factor [Candidatus Heimdallarchaeota archaeon]
MRLEDMATTAIEYLKKISPQGINNAELAKTLNVPKRRIYDVVAILKAADLITTSRDKSGTTLYWQGTTSEKNISTGNGNRIRSSKIKVSTTGFIVAVSNRGTEVIVESTSPSMTIEPA